jgi:hypothetical protein
MGSRDAGTPDGAQNCTNNPLKSLPERPGTLGSGGGVPTQHSDIIDKKHQKRPGTPGTPSANEGGAEKTKLRELAQWLRYSNDMNESRVRLIQPVPVGVPGVLSAIQKMSFSTPTMVQSSVPGVLGRSRNDINELTEGAGRSTGRSGAFHPPTEAEARCDELELASDRATDISLIRSGPGIIYTAKPAPSRQPPLHLSTVAPTRSHRLCRTTWSIGWPLSWPDRPLGSG